VVSFSTGVVTMRFLILLIGIFIFYLLLKNYFRNLQRPDRPVRPPAAENMVRCAQCGVNVPQTEAFFSRGEYFCSDEHRKQHQQ
jgi:uncharacterized protein